MKNIAIKGARMGPGGPFGDLRAPVRAFCLAGVAGLAVIFVLSQMLLGPAMPGASLVLACAGFLAAVGLGAVRLNRSYPHDRLGLCNLVTLARLMILGALGVALLEGKAPDLAVLTLAGVSLALDGVDGWLARRQGLASAFGARFDVEVDAAFALLLAVYAALSGLVGPYVVLLGLPYYAFMLARRRFPWLAAPLPERFSRKAVCVAQIATLILLLVPGMPSGLLTGLVLAVIGALAWSFGRDILWLYRGRA